MNDGPGSLFLSNLTRILNVARREDAYVRPMVALGELVQFPSSRSPAPPPLRCPRGHLMRSERMLVGSTACSCGYHRTWRCHCGAMTYGPELGEQCILVRRAAAPAGLIRLPKLDLRKRHVKVQ
jgi:hypothetical protein